LKKGKFIVMILLLHQKLEKGEDNSWVMKNDYAQVRCIFYSNIFKYFRILLLSFLNLFNNDEQHVAL
jgi:hypothetical protein